MFAIIPEALDYSETKKTLGLDYPKQTKVLENMQIVPNKENLRKYANQMPVHSVYVLFFPSDIPGWW